MDVLQYEYNNLKIESEKGVNKPMSQHDAALQEFINTGIDRTKVASMIYSINQNNKKGIGFTRGNSSEVILKPCSDKENLKTHFVSESEKVNIASCSELTLCQKYEGLIQKYIVQEFMPKICRSHTKISCAKYLKILCKNITKWCPLLPFCCFCFFDRSCLF